MSHNKGSASHPWHDLFIGSQAPDIFNAVIEIPKVKHFLILFHIFNFIFEFHSGLKSEI